MIKSIAIIIICAVAMLTLGIAALFFPDEIRSCILKVIGDKRGLFNLNKNSVKLMNSRQSIWSFKCAGVGALFMGLFLLWMVWRNLNITWYWSP